jgi:oligopeptide/dipeptide ABC transporter ATP-binding protein
MAWHATWWAKRSRPVESILRVRDLKKLFPIEKRSFFKKRERFVHAVDGVSFDIQRGETFGIVGESGCGKTTLARLLLRLVEPTSGRVFFYDQEITSLGRREMKNLRRKMQMIFQDPYSSLDPRKTILKIVAEPLKVHSLINESKVDRVKTALDLVDLPCSDEFLDKVPDELSGGQRQRVGIARTLVLGADFIIADEPVSMLDTNVKAGITSLMIGLKEKIGLTYAFITHEIGLAYYTCDRIAVMYLGKIVELGKAEEVIRRPLHPYTKLLMEAIPPLQPDEQWGKTITERGELPFFVEPPKGCRFHPRCSMKQDGCREREAELVEVGPGHFVACHYS